MIHGHDEIALIRRNRQERTWLAGTLTVRPLSYIKYRVPRRTEEAEREGKIGIVVCSVSRG
jgi:hypothetical protein